MIEKKMLDFLLGDVKNRCAIALVGGSDLEKISEQMGGMSVIKQFDYVFGENGLVALRKGEEIGRQNIQSFMGETKLQQFINFALKYLSDIVLPVKRGTFIEFRTGLINVCPVGRSCNQAERDQFAQFDAEHKIREQFVDTLERTFPDLGLTYSIGGQISFDVYPHGWDKTFCLKYLDHFDEIYFFGDKTDKGGNDHEIFNHPKTRGHKVTGPDDTKEQLLELFGVSNL
ncbi:hypothetical protein AAG570_012607 [Ranatra chinensis]|uniref:Phosphomannomutase n=1 Tax=Ranatra chinensis TaxID=642074 RepID=A0ABD0YEH1_9HEMI